MNAFKTDIAKFSRRSKIRVLYEVLLLFAITTLFLLDISSSISIWVKGIVLTLLLTYITLGVIFYPKAKSIAQSIEIRLFSDHAELISGPNRLKFSYRDSKIQNVKKKDGVVCQIDIETPRNGVLRLDNFERMNELYAILSKQEEDTQKLDPRLP